MKTYTEKQLYINEIKRLQERLDFLTKKRETYDNAPQKLRILWDKFNEMSTEERTANIQEMVKEERRIKAMLSYDGDIMKDFEEICQLRFAIQEWNGKISLIEFRERERNSK